MHPVTAAVALVLLGAVPRGDLRNEEIPHTKSHFRMPAYRTLHDWELRRAQLRRQILAAAGLWPLPPRVPLQARRAGRIERDRWSVEKVLIQTLPGYYLAGNLYLPRGQRGPFPGVLIPHGHWKHGRFEDLDSYSVPRLAANLAAQGYVAFAYDMAGYNDTTQTEHEFGYSPEEQLWSFGPLGLQLWNSMRALDFLESLPEVDRTRLAATGASGGGTQTFLLAAVDERVKVAAPVNMVSAIMQGGCACENAPGLRVGTHNVEIAALIAPRPMLLVSATGDWTRNTPRQEFPEIYRIYRLYGQPERLAMVQFEAEHNYDRRSREAVYWFFRKHLGRKATAAPLVETERPELEPRDLLVRPQIPLPAGAVDQEGLFRWWRLNAERQTRALSDAELRERLAGVIGARWPASIQALQDGEYVVLTSGHGDRVVGWWRPGDPAHSVLVVHPEGSPAARRTPQFEQRLASGASVLALDVFRSHGERADRALRDRFFLTFNRSDDSLRVQDILTGLAFLDLRRPRHLELVGLEKAGVWAIFAAALAPRPVVLDTDLEDFRGTDEDFRRDFFVPGIQRAGGLEAALRLLGFTASAELPSGGP